MADGSEMIGQKEIESLLSQAASAAQQDGAGQQGGASSPLKAADVASADPFATGPAAPNAERLPSEEGVREATGDDIQFLLDQAEQAVASVDQPAAATERIAPFQFEDFAGSPASEEKASLDLLRDVELDMRIELGRTDMHLEDVLKLRRGSVVALDKLAGDPVDVYVNGRLIARGEVLVLNDSFCVRVAELLTGDSVD